MTRARDGSLVKTTDRSDTWATAVEGRARRSATDAPTRPGRRDTAGFYPLVDSRP
jgi:hypothetical protein